MNGGNGFPVFLAFAVAIGIIVFVFAVIQRQQLQQTLESVARRFKGRLEPGDLLTVPQVRLKFQGYPALLKYVRVGKQGSHTVFTITWPDERLRCEIYPQDILSGFRKLWGMEDIEIGSPQFDRAFFIAGNSQAQVRDLLSAEVQTIVIQLTNVGGTTAHSTNTTGMP